MNKYFIVPMLSVLLVGLPTSTHAQTPTFTLSSPTVTEGSVARIVVSTPQRVDKTVRVRVRVTGNTATANRDYNNPGIVTVTFFRGGLTSKSIAIRTTADSIPEQAERATASIVSVDGKALTTPVTSTLTILDTATGSSAGVVVTPQNPVITPLPATTTYQGPGTGWTLSGQTISGTGGGSMRPSTLSKPGAGLSGVTPESSLTPRTEPPHPIECEPANAKLRERGWTRGSDFNFLSTSHNTSPFQTPVNGNWVWRSTSDGFNIAQGFTSYEVAENTFYSLRMDLDSVRTSSLEYRTLGGLSLGVPSYNNHTPPTSYFSISACPGDAGTNVRYNSSNATVDGNTVGTEGTCMFASGAGAGATVVWDRSWFGLAPNEKPNDGNRMCIVEPGKTYYINMFPTNILTGRFGCLPESQRINPNALPGELGTSLCTIGIYPQVAYAYSANASRPDLAVNTMMNMTAVERANAYKVLSSPYPQWSLISVWSTSLNLRNQFITMKQSEPYNLVTNPWGRR